MPVEFMPEIEVPLTWISVPEEFVPETEVPLTWISMPEERSEFLFYIVKWFWCGI